MSGKTLPAPTANVITISPATTGDFTLTGNDTIPKGVTLTITGTAVLTINQDCTLTNNGTINLSGSHTSPSIKSATSGGL